MTQFPSGKGKWKVSSQGGMLPRWRGREIFYLSRDHNSVYAADVTASEGTFRVNKTDFLFSKQAVAGSGYPYDVSADGKRFVFVIRSGETSSPLTLVQNWPAELKR